MRVAIVGHGLGGLSAAVSFRHYVADARVKIYEREASFKPEGYSIAINPRGFNSLTRLGLAELIETNAHPSSSSRYFDASGRFLVEVASPVKGPGRVLHVSRAILQRGLREQLSSDASAPARTAIQFNARVCGFEEDDAAVYLVLEGGRREGPFDVVVGADGVESAIARQLTQAPPESLGMLHLRGLNAALNREALCNIGQSLFLGTGATISTATTADFSGVTWGVCFRPPKAEREVLDPKRPLDESTVRQLAIASLSKETWYKPLVDTVLADIGAGKCVARRVLARPKVQRWRTGRVTLLGDAVHPMTPFEGYGANLAITDGLELGVAFARDLRKQPEQILRSYEAKVLSRGAAAAERSRLTANFFCLEGKWRVRVRNLLVSARRFFLPAPT